jgi:hypothetical protein
LSEADQAIQDRQRRLRRFLLSGLQSIEDRSCIFEITHTNLPGL